jgi:FSR family fosmidomycin resistance protein-like MFS transporter
VAGDRRVLLANSLYHLTNDGAVTILAGQIVILQTAFGGFGPAEVGFLGGVALLVTAVFQLLFGIMSDRRDPSRFLPVGIVILGLGSFLVALSSSFWTLLAFVAISRIGASFYHPVGIAWIGREFEGPELDHSMGFQSAFGDSGVILGMASGAVLAVAFGWQSPFVLWGVINLLAVAVGSYLVRRRTSSPVPTGRSSIDYFGLLRDVRIWLLPLAIGGAVFNTLSYFGPLLLHAKFGFAGNLAGVAVALWILVGSVGAFFFGRVSQRFGRYHALLGSYAALTIAAFVGGLVDNVWVVLLVLWTFGSALFLTYPALFSFVAESSHRRLQGAAFGVIFAFQLLGGALGLFLAGVLADAYGTTPALQTSIPFLLAGIFALIGFVGLLMGRGHVSNARKPSSSNVPPL